MIEPERDA